jgi:Tol biopolymer transport system component
MLQSERERAGARKTLRRIAPGLLIVAGALAPAARAGDASPADPTSGVEAPRAGFRSGVQVDSLIRPGEVHFKHLYQLTDGGENAEAYFSWDGRNLILQSTPRGAECDQIFIIPSDGGEMTRVSTGRGRCTCSYFLPGDKEVLFSSTHLGSPDCPPKPDFSQGYVWALYDTYDIFRADRDGSNLRRLTDAPGYDAEATVGPNGRIVFTSDRDGDIELYSMKLDGSDLKRLTHTPGYDGGAFYSPDGRKICFRASRPKDEAELKDFRDLLKQGLVRPSRLDIYVMNADGSHPVRLTDNGAANFCPFFHPGMKQVIYTSNVNDPGKRNFDIYLVDVRTKKSEQITFEKSFDGFPMFSPDGRRLVFASNRGDERPGETNIFVAEWTE